MQAKQRKTIFFYVVDLYVFFGESMGPFWRSALWDSRQQVRNTSATSAYLVTDVLMELGLERGSIGAL